MDLEDSKTEVLQKKERNEGRGGLIKMDFIFIVFKLVFLISVQIARFINLGYGYSRDFQDMPFCLLWFKNLMGGKCTLVGYLSSWAFQDMPLLQFKKLIE